MEKEYKKLKRISRISIFLFILLSVIMLIAITIKYIKLSTTAISDAPVSSAFLLVIPYVPFLIASLVIHIVFRRKIRIKFPDKVKRKEKLTKKVIAKRMIKAVVITVIICIVLSAIAPFAVVPLFVNRHVDYRGYATDIFPMQDIYKASDYGLNEKQMYLKTEDGLNIWTSEIYTEKPKAVIIYLSGIVQPSVTYFYGHAKFMQENGYASFLLEVRGHGNSDGNRISLGYEEIKDVKAVVNYIRSNDKYDGAPIVLHGASMGGAIAVNAFGQIEEIDGLIAMSAYSSFEDVVTDIMGRYGVPGFIQAIEKPLIALSLTNVFGSEAVKNMKPIVQIKNTKGRPALLIACSGDTEVPMVNMQRLKEANPKIETWLRDSWEHFIVQDCDFKKMSEDKEYCNKILSFLENKVINR